MLPHPQPDRNDHLGELLDVLTEMPEPGDEVYTSADEWPSEYDSIRVWLGSPTCREQVFDDLPDDTDVNIEF